MVIGMVIALALWFLALIRRGDTNAEYHLFRQRLGRAILLGLEILVAGDILRTVALEPTMESVTVLGLIVLIRTFLSFTLQLEIEGRWPWQPKEPGAGSLHGR